ncbi:MAG: SRPBCC domain-containing protein [Candidatus Sulfotelmatobacter sp.]
MKTLKETTTMKVEDLTLDVEQHIEMKATPEKAFAAVLYRLGKGNTRPDGQSLDLELEPKVGGRWYRDRGNGVGHFWGFVQVIKPSSLLELSGPMFMSYPVMNHVEVKIEPVSGGCRVALRHRAIGMIDPEHRKNVGTGWNHMLSNVKKDCEQR